MSELESLPVEEAAVGGKYSIRAVDRVCDILDVVRTRRGGASLSEVAEGTKMPKSSAFRYLSVLEDRNYIERNPQTTLYELGLAFQPQNSMELERLKRLANPLLIRLRNELGETTNLGLFDNGQVVHALVIESLQAMRLTARVGERGLIHSTALGKAMAAEMDEDTVRSILNMHGMPSYTPMTITSERRYLEQLTEVRANGYAIDDSENQIGGRCVAVLIPGLPVHAGLSVSAPAQQLPMERVPAVARELGKVAAALSAQMNR